MRALGNAEKELSSLQRCVLYEDARPLVCQLNKAQIQSGVNRYCPGAYPVSLAGEATDDLDVEYARAKKKTDCADEIGRRLKPIFTKLDELSAKVDILQQRLEHADDCAALYRSTIDRAVSSLTVRQTKQVAECTALDEYPPERASAAH